MSQETRDCSILSVTMSCGTAAHFTNNTTPRFGLFKSQRERDWLNHQDPGNLPAVKMASLSRLVGEDCN